MKVGEITEITGEENTFDRHGALPAMGGSTILYKLLLSVTLL